VFRVEDDYFLEQVIRRRPDLARFSWHGKTYQVEVPPQARLPALLTVDGVQDPPPGELVLVLTRKAGLRDLFRATGPFLATVPARRVE
jgi:hypothetical protein